MMQTPENYQVGHRKPPKHGQFKKGQSGNPGGKPGLANSLRARMRHALAESLEKPIIELRLDTDNALDDITRKLIRMANAGDVPSMKLLFALVEKFEPKEDLRSGEDISGTSSLSEGESQGVFEKGADAASGPQIEAKSGTSSLSQGESQGDFSNAPSRSEASVSEQAVDLTAEPPAGRIEETAGNSGVVPAPSEVPPRPKRPTIWIAGELVQQGD